MTPQSLLDLLYNRKLPQVYRDEDRKIGYPLKRYLESLIDGGFCGSIDDIEGVMLLVDPENIPDKFFPYLYESFGLEYFPDIDIVYQRKFLMNIGELIRRRGTFSSVQFLIKVLTGLEAELSYQDRVLTITLSAKTLGQIEDIETSMRVINNFIKTQIPYYVDPVIQSRIDTQVISSESYSFSSMGHYRFYKIPRNTGSQPDTSEGVSSTVSNGYLTVSSSGAVVNPVIQDGIAMWPGVNLAVSEDGIATFTASD